MKNRKLIDTGKKMKRVVSCVMMAALIAANINVNVFANGTSEGEAETISYEPLEIAAQSLNGNAIRGVNENNNASTMDNYAHFYSESINASGGLPNDGKITMDSGVPYVLAAGEKEAAYDGNDCIRLTDGNTEQSMVLDTLGVYENIYVLATAGGPGEGHYADFKVTLTYTEGESVETTYKLYDWYDLTSVPNVEKYYKIMRINNGYASPNGSLDNTNGPVLHSATIAVDTSRLLKKITFTMKGKDGNVNDKSGLYCCIFAVTGATPAGVPKAPEAYKVMKNEGSTTGAFIANWNKVTSATSYVIDVARDRKFTNILPDYNNKNIGNVTQFDVNSASIDPNITYYYRVRSVNDKGQSLSSNRVSSDIPLWIKNAIKEEDRDKVSYIAETNTITFLDNVILQDTLVLPVEDKTVIDLGGKTVTAPQGKPAVSAESGKDVELSIVSTNGESSAGQTGTIVGNGTDESGNGAPVIDFSNASGNSAISVTESKVTASSGSNSESGNGGNGGIGIAAGSSTKVEVGAGSEITGGNGGNGTTGNGGNGGTGISGGNVSVDANGKVSGGNGGDAVNGTGGTGGSGVSANKVTNSGTVSGGDGGDGSSGGGAGGSAGAANGTAGTNGSAHSHNWSYSVANNIIYAWCIQTNESQCSYYGTAESHDNALALTLTASEAEYSGSPYQGADVVNEITPVVGGTSVTKDSIQYYKSGEGTALGSAPTDAGEYTAKVTLGEKTAAVDFTIQKVSQSAAVSMADYSLNGTVSTPTISGQKESPTVTYYYNTTNSTKNGTKWENIGLNTLTPGIYYMYATLSETDNYNAYTTPTTSFRVGSLPTSIQNGSFETPAIGSWYSIMPETTPSIAWETTASDGKIEFARPSKNMSAANNAYHTTTAVDGYQFAELCANQVGALYQTVSTFSGDTLKWGFSHRGRSGEDTMELWIGTPADVTAVLNYYTGHNNSVAGIDQTDLAATYKTISQNSDGSLRRYRDGNDQWQSYTGDYVVPEGQTETTFAFVSISASGNRISYGNLLDNVYFTTQVPIKTQLFEYDATRGGSVTARIDDNPVNGKEAFVSVGSTIEFTPSANTGYAFNGGFVNGRYIPVGMLPPSYTVSETDTDLKHITVLFSKDSTIVFDKEGGNYEDDEWNLIANTCYTLKENPTKEGYAFKNWIIAGSDVTLTAGNYIAYETGDDGKTYIRVYNSATDRTTPPLYECLSEFGINLIATYEFTAFPTATVELKLEGGEVDGNVGPLTHELNKFDLSYTNEQSNDKIEYSPLTLPTPTRGVYAFKGWKIGERVYDAGTDIKYALSTAAQNGTVTIGMDVQEPITADTTYTLTAQWETISITGVTATGVTKVYDGSPSAITVSELPASTTVTYGTTEGTYDLSTCPTYTDVGTYTVYYKVSGDGYNDYTGSAQITITPRPVTLTWSTSSLTYNGSAQGVTAEISNKAKDADSFTITYENNQKTAVGEYTARVTELGNSNYTLTDATGVTQNWSINYLVTDAKATPSGDTKNDSGWFTGDVTLTPDSGYQISKDGTTWSDTLTVTSDGEAAVTYQLKNGSGSITDQKTLTVKKDSAAPGGEIKVADNSFMGLLNEITFGYFFKNTVDVSIQATDNASGVAKIEYKKVGKGESFSAEGTWTEGTSFSIKANEKSAIYARITDIAGNTVIINSQGNIVYTDATVSDSVEYTKTTRTDVSSLIQFNGNTVKGIKYGDTVLTRDVDYQIQEDKIILKGDYLESFPVGEYRLTVSYYPYGEVFGEGAHGFDATDSTITVSIKRVVGEKADTKITNLDSLPKVYDGQPTESATTSSKNSNAPKVEYKKKGEPDSAYTEELPKEAGDYVVRVTYPQDANYEETTTTEEFAISPKEVTAVVSASSRTYDGTTAAEVTATVDTGFAGQTLTITGLTGTFDNKNVGTDKTVTVDSTKVVVKGGEGTNAGNFKVIYPATAKADIRAEALTVKAKDTEKHIGYKDPAYTYTVVSGRLVEGETLSGLSYSREAGEKVGGYTITATETPGSNPNYVLTLKTGKLTILDHTAVIDSAVEPTCTKTGLSKGSHCSLCDEVIVKQEVVAALGHDWTGEWKVTKEATDTEEGQKEKTCQREDCGVKKYEAIPKIGTTDDLPANVSGTLEKNAEVAPDSPIPVATLDNKKSELLNAPSILTAEEKQKIKNGTDAKVWLEVKKTDESKIPAADKTKMEKEAEKIIGENPVITYFDADLFKQISGGKKEQLHEPGIDISVTIVVPDDLLNHDKTMIREYKIIRLHNGEISILTGDFNEASKEFTFATDKFSTYLIAYTDIQLVTGIALTPASATLTNVGATLQLTATVTPDDVADKSLTWTSSNTAVATVDTNGKVTAVANGTCTITATSADGGQTATSTITVSISDDGSGSGAGAGTSNGSGDTGKLVAPKTNDDNNLVLWTSLLFLSMLGVGGLLAGRKKRRS